MTFFFRKNLILKAITCIKGPYMMFCAIWYHFYNLKNVKNTHRGVLLLGYKPETLIKVTLHHGCFSRFLNCTSGTKSRNASNIWKSVISQPVLTLSRYCWLEILRGNHRYLPTKKTSIINSVYVKSSGLKSATLNQL